MTKKRIAMAVLAAAFLAAAVWLIVSYFGTSRQIYEGVLVYKDSILPETRLAA